MIIPFIIFLFLLIINLKNKSVVVFLIFVQLISIGGSFFLGREVKIDDITDYMIIFLITFLLYFIVMPWKSYYNVRFIVSIPDNKLRKITNFLIITNSISFVVLLIITIIVQTTITDINEFKYTPGVNQDFITNNLPFPLIFFSIAIVFSNFSFFILPLHFFYLHKNKILLSIICLVLSTNIMLIGFTYFSRAVVIQYLFLYIAMLLITYQSFNKKIKKTIRKSLVFCGVLSIIYLINVTVNRFKEDTVLANKYAKTIPVSAITQDPLIYSYLDYLSQGYINGFEIIKDYNGKGFNGSLSLEKLLVMTTSKEQAFERQRLRQELWPYEYAYSFNGFPAYSIYDYGILGSILFCLLYYFIVYRMRPRNKSLQLKDFFLIVLLLEIPLMSIFYSEVGGAFLAFILYMFILLYLKIKGI